MTNNTERKALFEQACEQDDIESLLEGADSLEDVFKAYYTLCERLAPLAEADKASIREIALANIEEKRQAHCSPWWTEGLKADLRAQGLAVEMSELLDEFFEDKDHAQCATMMIRENGVEEAARKIANGELFDDPYRGNFSGFSARVITSCWRRLRII